MELLSMHLQVPNSFFLVYIQVIILPWISCFNPKGLNLLGLAHAATAVGGNDTDLQALLQFKAMITGDQLKVMSSWNSSIHFCQWHGVTCGRNNRRVIKLELQFLKLSGSLSPFIGNLSFLMELNLVRNNFHSQIPQEIGRLRRLEALQLSNNSITGEIPSNLSSGSELTFVSMRGNKLTGEIPASLGLLSNMKTLSFAINRLRGSIPPSFGNLSSLEALILRNNALSGVIPEDIGRLTNLSFFHVEENAISGIIPVGMFNLSNIRSFDIGGNNIQGTLPSNLAITMPYIDFFSVWGNQLSGKIPISISNASNLNLLQLYTNRFIGNVPSFEKLDKLSYLLLGTNHLGNGTEGDLNFLCSLVNNSKLDTLDIGTNNFGGVLPKCISNFSSTLLFLVIENNKILGRIPDGIGNLINLEVLRVSQNQLSGPIPLNIGRIQKLNTFDARYNFLTGTIPYSAGNLTGLMFLALGLNNFQGSIPSSLGNCQNLLVLGLSYNNLSGSIPPQVLGLSSLSILLNLSSNYLTGELPVEVENLKNLGDLDFSKNKLSGLLPKSLGSCVRLERLFLGGNLFEGPIPSSLSSLRGLVELDISENNLSGGVPEFLVNFGALKYINLSFNNFEGVIPSGGVFKNASAVFVEGNNKLCGGIPELHLSRCNSKTSSKTSLRFKIVIVVVVILGVTLVLSIVLIIWFRKRKVQQPMSTLAENSLLWLTYQSILKATNEFSMRNLVGSGSFGSVYKGILEESGVAIAVKVLNLLDHRSSRSFLVECETLKNIRHRNLVKVLTAISGVDYQGNDFKALVYEFMVNGSLEDWLHSPTGTSELETMRKLNFFQRVSVAIDVAHALEYLHHHCETSIIHCDLKPSNILLDEEMVGHISDFGLAKIISADELNCSTKMSSSLGLRGTIALPIVVAIKEIMQGLFKEVGEVHWYDWRTFREYGMGSELSTKGDVYGYGILLLEMFTGKRPTDERFRDGLSLHNFVKAALPEQIIEITDPILVEERVTRRTPDLSYQSILRATDGFSTQNLVGSGSFGSVYKGVLEASGAVIAVKVLNLLNRGASRSFLAECEALKNIRHRNLVKVLTAISGVNYQGNDFKALVYEFMENGSLEDWLHPFIGMNEPETARNLNFFQRVSVAIDVAHALEYLHHHCEEPIIHCDLKPSNILLDEEMVGHISDFGLAKILFADKLNYSTNQSSSLGLRGTIGYAPPEYGLGSELSTKGDVYSYGILLLEMFTGKRPTHDMFKEGFSIHIFVMAALPERITEIIDPILLQERSRHRTPGNITFSDRHLQHLNSIFEIGLACSAESPSERMDMSDVVSKLCSIRDKLLRPTHYRHEHQTYTAQSTGT
ncbi:hypothetical protein GOBAR_DD32621 [Gossypium barbadense]|nr:hypothetical protein GOBAR_DD32621 [Gossypium barbadense]